jgi:hypothetical protein
MKSITKPLTKRWAFLGVISILFTCACHKQLDQYAGKNNLTATTGDHGHLKQTKTFSADVATKWMALQMRLMGTTAGIPNQAFARPYAYSGIVLYESVVEGMPAFQSLVGQLTAMPAMPQKGNGMAYHWPASANAGLASINRLMFPTTSDANKASIDSLENALNLQYQSESDASTLGRSIEYGKSVAEKIFEWAQTDGFLHASDPYNPPIGDGLWVPTPPAFAAPSTPYLHNMRLMIAGSGDNTQPGAPTPYSIDPSSDFYNMVKQVYVASQTLTAEQTAMAFFWRDLPGVSTPGHYISILEQVLVNEQSTLDKAAIAYAMGGITAYDAIISCWTTKYHYNLVRPITYIRTVLGHSTWNSLLTTPAHPEYSSAHAVASSATADILTNLFGDNYRFTDHTYDYLGMAPRSFPSFKAMGEDAGNSRLYAGIHYQPSINTGLLQGRKVAQNIINTLKFSK